MIALGLAALGVLGLLLVFMLTRPRKRPGKGTPLERLPDSDVKVIDLVGKRGARRHAK